MNRVDEYRQCAASGKTYKETARALGVTVSAVRRMASVHRIHFSDGNISSTLSFAERRDYVTLLAEGGYSPEEAIAIIQRPKVKMRAAPKEGGK